MESVACGVCAVARTLVVRRVMVRRRWRRVVDMGNGMALLGGGCVARMPWGADQRWGIRNAARLISYDVRAIYNGRRSLRIIFMYAYYNMYAREDGGA